MRYFKDIILKDDLINLYSVEHRSMPYISQIYGCSYYTIWHALNKYNIPIRSSADAIRLSKSKHIAINDNFSEILDGLLLGDGHLSKPMFQAHYAQNSSQKEFIDYVANVFKENNYYQNNKYINVFDNRSGKFYDRYVFYSKNTMEFLDLHNRWYPDGKKHVPQDINLTPNTVLFWYLGDGSICKNASVAYLHTCGFSLNEQQILINAFYNVGIIVDIVYWSNFYRLHVGGKENFYNFMKYMGKNPVACYDYKFIPEFRGDEKNCHIELR